MTKVKAVIWLLIFGFLALVVYQNEGLFPQHAAAAAPEPAFLHGVPVAQPALCVFTWSFLPSRLWWPRVERRGASRAQDRQKAPNGGGPQEKELLTPQDGARAFERRAAPLDRRPGGVPPLRRRSSRRDRATLQTDLPGVMPPPNQPP